MRRRLVLIEATARRLLSPRNYHKEEVVQGKVPLVVVLAGNDGATVGGGEREEHRVGAGGRSEKAHGGRTRRATGEGRARKEEDKETQLTTP